MSKLQIKNPTFAKHLEEKTKDDPIMNEFLNTIIENSYETAQFNKKYADAIDRAISKMKEGNSNETRFH